MKKLATIISIFIILGCRAEKPPKYTGPPIDQAQIEHVVQQFNEEFGVFVDSTLIFNEDSYADLSTSGTGTLGKCIVQTNHIIIDKRFWDDAPSSVREALLFHELGHCMLGLGHDNVRGIMSSFIGHNANSFAYEFKEGIEYMKQMPCEFGCDLDRIITNRGEEQ